MDSGPVRPPRQRQPDVAANDLEAAGGVHTTRHPAIHNVGARPDAGAVQDLADQMSVMVKDHLLGVADVLKLLDSVGVRHGPQCRADVSRRSRARQTTCQVRSDHGFEPSCSLEQLKSGQRDPGRSATA